MQTRLTRLRSARLIYAALLLLLGLAITTGLSSASRAQPAGPQLYTAAGCTSDWAILPSLNSGFLDNTLYAVAATSPDDAWAVGSYIVDTLTYSTRPQIQHWDGTAWSFTALPEFTATTSLRGVAAISSTDAWAVGQSAGRTLTMHWDGTQWSVIASPNISGTACNLLYDVAAISSNDMWAVGQVGNDTTAQPITMHWDGSEWTMTTQSFSPETYPTGLYGVDVIASNDVWAVGARYISQTHGSGTLTMHWDGTSWSQVSSPDPGPLNFLESVTAVTADDVWAVGHANGALILHWDGSAWSVVPHPNPATGYSQLYSVSAASASDIWAVGHNYVDSGNVKALILHWDGNAWSIVPSPNPTGAINKLWGVTTLPSGEAWTVGFGNDSVARTLVEQYPSSNCTTGTAVPATNTQQAHSTGTAAATSTPTRDCCRAVSATMTADCNGNSYTYAYGLTNACSQAVSANGGLFFEVSPNENGPWTSPIHIDYFNATFQPGYTEHSGSLWQGAVPPGNNWFRMRLYLVGANSYSCWTVNVASAARPVCVQGTATPSTSSTPSRTSTAVPTATATTSTATPTCPPQWLISPIPDPVTSSNRLLDVAVVSHDDVWAVGVYLETGRNQTLAMHWNGNQWLVVPSPNPGSYSNALTGVAAAASNDVWAVGSYNNSAQGTSQTLTMRWDGSSWNVVQSPNFGSNSTYLSKVAALSSEDVWAIGGYNIGPDGARPISLHWDGSQWSTIQMPYGPGFAHSLVDISAVAPDDIWAVGGSFDGFMSRTSIEHWNGNEWSIIPSPNPGPNANALYGVTAITTNDVWAVGYYYPNMSSPSANLVLHWDGSVWTQVAAPNAGTSSNNLWDVDAVAGNDVWAIGTFLNAGVEETLALHWDGSQWAVVPTPNSGSSLNRLFGVAASAADDVWAVGYTSTQSLIERYSSQCVTVTPTPSITPPVTASATSTTVPPTACTSTFTDVDETNAFYPYIRCLACRGIISGYDDGTFRPFNDITRGQIAKIVSNAAGFDEDPGPQIYEDVPVGSPFYQWINRLSMRGHIGGYPCGLMEGEPCIEPDNLPYFRPSNSATRGQLAKIVANAAGVEGTPSGIIYSDVPEDHPFYLWIMRLTEAGVMSGYPCGAPGEPCNPQSRPFFRPSNNVTRGQASKIVANTFFPGCQTP